MVGEKAEEQDEVMDGVESGGKEDEDEDDYIIYTMTEIVRHVSALVIGFIGGG
jgi:hypothetical protein